ncbi:unnamed protein product [Schistosoma curassoni]|uniref:Uncharacterized protein n=1 Tax=Schistosoma curassoni TaxID=6186 RepID=A0A183JRY8_9TREM|nr:unnamed protein product [Schistosoma curassoni]
MKKNKIQLMIVERSECFLVKYVQCCMLLEMMKIHYLKLFP